ncbi:hypothetical protein DFS33DRAFT_1347628 [Desarmillaria ectypa]|nr:hypothetical protein DFS33DRAFT_1347628 [Desarmillaria ectypa]
MQWTTTKPSLTQKYPVYFTAVQYFLADIRHYNVIRYMGELLSATEYEDDLDLEEDDDGDMEEDREEEDSSEATDESEASSSTEESTYTSDMDGSQSYVSDGVDPESDVQTPPRKILLHDTASLGSAYRLGERHDSRSPIQGRFHLRFASADERLQILRPPWTLQWYPGPQVELHHACNLLFIHVFFLQ